MCGFQRASNASCKQQLWAHAINISNPTLSSEADLHNKKGKFAPVKNITKSACSTNKLNHARKMTKKRCIEDDAEAHEIDENNRTAFGM